MSVKLKLKLLREGKYTQRQMGDLLGMTESNYRRLESNSMQSITFDAIEKLCRLFSCTPNDLIEILDD